jgi:hypothetical protein
MVDHLVDDRDPPGEASVLAGRIDDDAQHADQAVLERDPIAIRGIRLRVGRGVGHAGMPVPW